VAGHPRDLTDLPLQLTYRTGRDDLVRGFFVPCLETAVLYRRAAGYFTSAGLALAARGVASLALRRGHMRLVVSPHLEPDDCAALERARDTPAAVLRTIAARSLAEIEDALLKDRLNALAWLAAAGLLEIKLALRVTAQGGYARGLFHAKTGVFSDDTGHHVSFSGSANETAGGLVENFEHLDVFRSWQDPEGRVQAAIDDFESLWAGQVPGLHIIDFSQASRALLERYRNPDQPPPGIDPNQVREPGPGATLAPPVGLDLRPYQKDAIRAWSKAGGRGVFAMATGSGKTITALVLASKVAERNHPLVLLIVCPFINLCRQRIREIAAFGVVAIPCFEGRHRWQAQLEECYQRLTAALDQVQAIITTPMPPFKATPVAWVEYRERVGATFHPVMCYPGAPDPSATTARRDETQGRGRQRPPPRVCRRGPQPRRRERPQRTPGRHQPELRTLSYPVEVPTASFDAGGARLFRWNRVPIASDGRDCRIWTLLPTLHLRPGTFSNGSPWSGPLSSAGTSI